MANYIQIIPVKCDCCGNMVDSYSNRSNWWGKYLRPGEEKVCHNCLKGRDGYAEEFLEKIGVSVDNYDVFVKKGEATNPIRMAE